ncbi:MAG: GLPGLI family protein [Bacteroidota bacterium]
MRTSLLGKYFWYTVFFVFSINLFAQEHSGTIHYAVVNDNDLMDNLDTKGKDLMSGIFHHAKQLEFVLDFNEGESSFQLKKMISLQENNMNRKMAITLYGGKSKFYTNLESGYVIEQKDFLNKQFLVKKSLSIKNWKLTTEEKSISGYICFKAVGQRYSTDKEFNKTFYKVSAWYCPELSLGFGPFEAVGLPGIVLEFNLKGYSLVASKLDFTANPKITRPNKGTSITQEEFDTMINEMAKNN